MKRLLILSLTILSLLSGCQKEEVKPDGTLFYNKVSQFTTLRTYTDQSTYTDSYINDFVVWKDVYVDLGTKTRMYYHQKEGQGDFIQTKDSSTFIVKDWQSSPDTIYIKSQVSKGNKITNYYKVFLLK